MALVLCLAGCIKKARLYNLTTGEVTEAQFSYSGTGKGKITAMAASGENFRGEYRTIPGGDVSWGAIYAGVYGSAVAGTSRMSAQQRGSAIATGDKGTIIQCEYITSAWNGAGTGACKDSHGTLYKLMF